MNTTAERQWQAITGPEERQKLFREFSPSFFDLIVIDECRRGSAAEDAAGREILEYFLSATQIGTAESEFFDCIHFANTTLLLPSTALSTSATECHPSSLCLDRNHRREGLSITKAETVGLISGPGIQANAC
jgi:hypothetical protein